MTEAGSQAGPLHRSSTDSFPLAGPGRCLRKADASVPRKVPHAFLPLPDPHALRALPWCQHTALGKLRGQEGLQRGPAELAEARLLQTWHEHVSESLPLPNKENARLLNRASSVKIEKRMFFVEEKNFPGL